VWWLKPQGRLQKKRQGILLKNPEALQTLEKPREMMLYVF
jgi:hypothetical protein